MSTASEHAQIIWEQELPALAELYDRFAHSMDPYSTDSVAAEKIFNREIAEFLDSTWVPSPKPPFHDFRKAIIIKCKAHLKQTSKPDLFRPFKPVT